MTALTGGGGLPGSGGFPLGTASEASAGGARAAPSGDLRRAWTRLLRERWSSLVLAPTEMGAPVRAVAAAAVGTAQSFGDASVHVVEAQGASLADAARLRDEIDRQIAAGARVVITIDPPLQHAGGTPLLVSAHAVLLVVRLGTTRLDAILELSEMVPSQRLLGCVTYR